MNRMFIPCSLLSDSCFLVLFFVVICGYSHLSQRLPVTGGGGRELGRLRDRGWSFVVYYLLTFTRLKVLCILFNCKRYSEQQEEDKCHDLSRLKRTDVCTM